MDTLGENELVSNSLASLKTATEGSPGLEDIKCNEENNWDETIAKNKELQSVGECEETEDVRKLKIAVSSPEDDDNDIEVSDDDDGVDNICDDEGDSDNLAVTEGSKKEEISKQNKRNRKRKSQKRRKSHKKSKATKRQRLENEQKGKTAKLIEGLSIHLTKYTSPKINRSTMGVYQTKSFQLAAQHIITKDPVDQLSFCDISSVNGVFFVWLSCVSAEMFLKESSNFVNLSKLPSYPFLIVHPGSETFCENGSDAFLTIKTNTDFDMRLKRTRCILSPEQLKENDYPTECSCHDNNDLHQYVSNLEAEEGELGASSDTHWWCLSDKTGFPEVTDESPLFAIDCEMVSTIEDSLIGDIARVSVVNEQEECIYDTFVKPYTPVTDYRTKYSGITEDLLDGVSTTLADVQQKMKQLIPADAILVGQSLENDFHSLKLFHPYVIDTSLLFTNNSKYKPKLRVLAQHLLKTAIQTSDKGHSSIEDALTCMRLVQLKLKKGMVSYSGHITSSRDGSHSVGLFQVLASRNKNCAFIDCHANVLDYSQGNIHSIVAATDAEAVKCAQSAIKSNDVVWMRLDDMQDYLTQPGTALADAKLKETLLHQEAVHIHTDNATAIALAASKQGASKEELTHLLTENRLKAVQCLHQSIHVYQDAYKQEAVSINKIIRQLDAHVYNLIRACPNGTLVFVVCGSSYVERVPLLFKASKHCPSDQLIQAELRRVVKEAREGLVLAHFVMHD